MVSVVFKVKLNVQIRTRKSALSKNHCVLEKNQIKQRLRSAPIYLLVASKERGQSCVS